jgi:hypothetical protein
VDSRSPWRIASRGLRRIGEERGLRGRRIAVGLVLLALVVAARGLARHTTWYLASDQFAFLAFADDLRHGTIFRDPRTVALLAGAVPAGETADAYYQTYLWRDGRLWSRYPPGFPILLAGAGLFGGERAMHALNPLLYLVLLAALALFSARLLHGAPIAAGAAATAPWALLVIPTEAHYWGITVARDLPAHLLGLAALVAACAGRFGLAGLALGFACTIRPDAILYALSLGAIALVLRPRFAAVLAGTAAFVVGATPLLAYNTVTEGHPLAFTQGMEFRHVLGVAPAATSGVVAALPPLVSGGGFQLRYLLQVLPQNLAYLAAAFGMFLVTAVGALAWAARWRPVLAAALGPHLVGSVLFFSCWGRSDPRYLVGAVLALLILTATGMAGWCAALCAPIRSQRTRLALLALTLAAVVAGPVLFPAQPQRRPLEVAAGGAALVAGMAALVPAATAGAAALAPLAPGVAFAGVGLWRLATGSGSRDPFQAPQVERARRAIEAVIPPGALVITTPALGRPAENITRYTHADADYEGELEILRSSPAAVAARARAAGRRVFVLLPSTMPRPLPEGSLVEVARRRGRDLYDWFVDPAHASEAVLLEVVRLPGESG